MARGKKNTDDLPKAKLTRSTLSKSAKLFSYNKENLWKFYVGIIFLLLTSATALIFPKFMGELADTAKDHNIERANELGLLLVIVLIGQSVFSYFRIYLFVNFTENTLAKLRIHTYEHLIKLPMTYFSEKRVGELNSRLSADVNLIQDTLTTTIAEFARQIILIVGGIALLAVYSVKLTLLMLSIVPIVAVAGVILGRLIRKISKQVQDKVAESNTVVEETLQGIANVKAFANELYEIIRYQKSIDEIVKLATRNGMYRGGFASFIIFCVFGAIVAVVWYGVILTINGELTIGSLLAFVLYSVFVGAAIGGTAELYAQIQKSVGATERIFEILEESTEPIDIHAHKNPIKLNGDVSFKEVAFTYPSRKEMEVLKSISFNANKGETIAIVGPSGAGKTTIASLLLRFYTPQKGIISIDGKDYNSYPLSQVRNNIAIVPQDVLLFGGSIKENIAYGKPDATLEEIKAAAQKANALSFIESFPEKFETIVGERGIKLSGGQRQRIAIARAVLKNPAILILDEATSSLDSESERLVQEALDNLMVGRTSIVIAHRLSTIRKADKIVVMDKGLVKELGTHEELIAIENGLYKNLSRLQFEVV
ncbi:MAG: ATP-binding cassette domain-containing protein [Bacteroidetes bacterium]|nr:ATP-binding cassette domain-containing protein [Bacteroidota bacterium]